MLKQDLLAGYFILFPDEPQKDLVSLLSVRELNSLLLCKGVCPYQLKKALKYFTTPSVIRNFVKANCPGYIG